MARAAAAPTFGAPRAVPSQPAPRTAIHSVGKTSPRNVLLESRFRYTGARMAAPVALSKARSAGADRLHQAIGVREQEVEDHRDDRDVARRLDEVGPDERGNARDHDREESDGRDDEVLR